jgi:hypothetical protein
MTDSLLLALVARNRWLLARPAARATGLAPPAGVRSPCAGRSGSLLEHACHADRLVLGSSGSSRHWSRSALAGVRSRSLLERACHADRLVLGSSGSSRHWSRFAGWCPLIPRWSPLSALVAQLSPLVARP